MKKTLLFAVDLNAQLTIVSESSKGSNSIEAIARIARAENELLFDAVSLLTKISKSSQLDPAIFKASDKLCQAIYEKHVGEG